MAGVRATKTMPEQQQFLYFMSDDPEPVHGNSPLWGTALPLDRHQQSRPETAPADETLTYGEFFEAVSIFIDTHLSDYISKAIFHAVKRTIASHEISHIHIHLEKHGAFYHPARIVLLLADCRISLVVNVAISTLGKNTIKNDYGLLTQLANRTSPAWVPWVFGYDRVRIDGQRYAHMFLGEWFEDFHEFHVSEKSSPDKTGIRVWDPKKGHLFLSRNQTQHVFEQAAMILTVYYNVETFEQITSWHHAAGDFVVCLHEDEPSLKLITVRAYKPFFNVSEEVVELETILNTLLIFLLNLSIRLRVDRLDGVGDVAWVEANVVPGIFNGFFKGLALQVENSYIPHDLIEAFKTFLLHLPEMDIRDILMGIVNQFDPKNPDLAVIKQNIDNHVEMVLSELRRMKISL
jgi:hypothetical protein